MYMFKEVHDSIITALYATFAIDESKTNVHKITVDMSRKANSGDLATNVAMVIAKTYDMEPMAFAERLLPRIKTIHGVESCVIAQPGFINLTMEPMWWLKNLMNIMKNESNCGTRSKYNSAHFEYVSANPTGPLHVGHARGAIIGDVLASIYDKCGYHVTREYYVNDAGGQIDVLVNSVYHEYLKLNNVTDIIIPQVYKGEVIEFLAKAWNMFIKDEYINQMRDNWQEPLREFVLPLVMDRIKSDLNMMGVKHDVFTHESEIVDNGGVVEALHILRAQDLTYKGVLPPPKGKEDAAYDSRKQLLFKSTEFGDDVDRPLKKADGSWTYFATDIAYHADKFKRGHKNMINIMGADHAGYTSRISAAVRAVSHKQARVDTVLCQMVNLVDNGEKVKQSKRDGTYVTVEDVVNKVGKDALRFTMMTRKADAHLDFDYQKVVEETKDNMVYYVQYAHARAHSVLNKAVERPEFEDICVETLSRLNNENEMSIVKHLSTWGDILQKAADKKEPHHITYYLYELAGLFHSLHSKGNNDKQLRFLIENDDELQMARLILVQSVAHVLKSGLDVLGVSAPTKM